MSGTDKKAADTKTEVKTEVKPALDLSFITSGAVTLAPELAAESAPVRSRSDHQRAMDDVVDKLHKVWSTSDDKPTDWTKLVAAKCVATYFIEPEKVTELKKLITRAVGYHEGTRARFGTSFKATAELIRKYNLPEAYLGREVVSFAILDKRPRATSGGKTAKDIIK